MENPATWDEATEIVYHAWAQAQLDDESIGLSTPRRITDALRAAGYDLDTKRGSQ